MKRLIKITLFLFFVIIVMIASTGIGLWYLWSSNLPYIGSLKDYHPPIITEIFADDGQLMGQFWDERRVVVPLDEISGHLVNAFIAAEDARFFQHQGIDFLSILRALLKNIKAGRIEQGGSTITQQVTKTMEMVSAAKLRKAQKRIRCSTPGKGSRRISLCPRTSKTIMPAKDVIRLLR